MSRDSLVSSKHPWGEAEHPGTDKVKVAIMWVSKYNSLNGGMRQARLARNCAQDACTRAALRSVREMVSNFPWVKFYNSPGDYRG